MRCSHTTTVYFPLVIKDCIYIQISRTSISNPRRWHKYRPGGMDLIFKFYCYTTQEIIESCIFQQTKPVQTTTKFSTTIKLRNMEKIKNNLIIRKDDY